MRLHSLFLFSFNFVAMNSVSRAQGQNNLPAFVSMKEQKIRNNDMYSNIRATQQHSIKRVQSY